MHQWERHSWECWQRDESIWHGTIRLLFPECSPFRTDVVHLSDSLIYCGSKILGVVQGTLVLRNVLCRSEKPHVAFPPALSEVFLPLPPSLSLPPFFFSLYVPQLKAKYVFNNSEMTFDIILNWVSEANIIYHSILVFFLYFCKERFSMHSLFAPNFIYSFQIFAFNVVFSNSYWICIRGYNIKNTENNVLIISG